MHIFELTHHYIACLTLSMNEQEQVTAMSRLLRCLVAEAKASGLAEIDRFELNVNADSVPGAGINMLSNDVEELTRRLLIHIV